MDRSAKTPSQLPGDLDRFHRHFREVDRDDDVSNFQRFHGYTMNLFAPCGLASLGKSQPFCATSHPTTTGAIRALAAELCESSTALFSKTTSAAPRASNQSM